MITHKYRLLVITTLIFLASVLTFSYLWQQLTPNPIATPANFLAADKGYGVTIDLTQYDDKALTDTLLLLRENNLLWLRQPILWSQIEPMPGQFNWAPLDRVFTAIQQNNRAEKPFKVIAVLHTTPQWARAAHSSVTAPPLEISNFGIFTRAFAQRYGPQLDHYQIWHEPNLSANWGHTFVNPSTYTTLLREAALNIRDTDPAALILTAGLAPTRENGPLNLNEMEFLAQLYQAKANRWFDIVAGQPYGFDFTPTSPAQTNTLNFQRLTLLRQVMLNYNDADTPIWATAFGWNALPLDWAGQPAPWRDDQTKTDPPQLQTQRTSQGIAWARNHWPWLGPMLAIRWDSANLSPDDPLHGFALAKTPLLEPFQQAARATSVATVGRYPANHPGGQYSPGWRSALTLADIPHQATGTLTIPFEGTRLDLTVNRGPYRGYLWVKVDKQPANALPQNTQGRSYLVLYDPQNERQTVTLAQNLPPGQHTAIIKADGGWEQWAIGGWTVSGQPDTWLAPRGMLIAGIMVLVSGAALLWQSWPPTSLVKKVRARLLALPERLPNDTYQVTIIFALALLFYLAPQQVALGLLIPLALAIIYRPDLGLVLLAFSLSFFQAPKQLPPGEFLLTEGTLLITTIGFGLRFLPSLKLSPREGGQNKSKSVNPPSLSLTSHLKALDWAALALLLTGFASTLVALNFGVSMFQWRILVLGSVGYYFLVRLGPDYGPLAQDKPLRWAWRLIDALVAGAVLHSVIVLMGYFTTNQALLTEGVWRAMSPVYGSPNNLALYLGRVWPVLLAVAVLPAKNNTLRRWLYGFGLIIVGLTLYLTFSRGALLLGVPVGLMAIGVLYTQRHSWQHWGRLILVAGGCLVILILALIPLSQTARFRAIFEVEPGSTTFFRLKLWPASLAMLADYWPLGMGLNNFLYQYRTRYILPQAWQEPDLSHPHNIVLDFGIQLGLGGLAVLVWLQGAFWLTAWRLYKKIPEPFVLGLMGSMAVFLSHGLIDNAYFLVDLAFVFFLTAGLVQGLADR